MKTTMKKNVARIITLVMVLAMMMSFAVPAMAAEINLPAAESLDEVKHGVFKFNMQIDMSAAGGSLKSRGTAFLINEDHIITAAHCVRFTEYEANMYGYTLNEENKVFGLLKTEPKFSVTVERDLVVGATLVNMSESMDFAILKLDQPIPTRKYLILRDSRDIKAGENVFSVGFPAFYDNQNYDNNYTVDDVTVKSGVISKIQNVTEFKYGSGQVCKLDILATTCNLSGGDSGGPMVDQNGCVVGVSIAGVDQSVSNNYYMASAIDQVMRACDNLGIEYHTTEEAAVVTPVATEAAPAVVETVAPTVAPTEAPVVVETQAPVVETAPVKEDIQEGGMNMTTILIIAAVAVVAVIVVIVVVMGKSKKKPAPVQQAAYSGAGQTAGFQTNSFTQPMGAGETTVLGGNAGETTILGRGANGGTLIRKRTNETIAINADRFVIGRERSRSNYCIADNSSISRAHVTLSVRGGTTFLMDMNAANGTFVNGVKVAPNQEVALKNGDRVKLSDEEFEFRA